MTTVSKALAEWVLSSHITTEHTHLLLTHQGLYLAMKLICHSLDTYVVQTDHILLCCLTLITWLPASLRAHNEDLAVACGVRHCRILTHTRCLFLVHTVALHWWCWLMWVIPMSMQSKNSLTTFSSMPWDSPKTHPWTKRTSSRYTRCP